MTIKKGDVVKVKLLSKDGKSQEVVERKILALSASGTTCQIQGIDNKLKWTPITNIINDDLVEKEVEENLDTEKDSDKTEVKEDSIAEKAKGVMEEIDEMAKKAKQKSEKKPKSPKKSNLKDQIIALMKEGKTNEEIKSLLPQASLGYISPIRSAYYQWVEPKEGTVKKAIIDAHRKGKTIDEIIKLTGSSLAHVKFQVETFKRLNHE